MKHLKIFENFFDGRNDDPYILPIGTEIKFDGRDCEIIQHKSNIHNEIFYLIRYKDNGSEEVIVPRDKRIEPLDRVR
jgi:hypothetical protein